MKTFKPRPCAVCKKPFTPGFPASKFCSETCKGDAEVPSQTAEGRRRWKQRVTGVDLGDIDLYFSKLVTPIPFPPGFLRRLFDDQEGGCAISGVEMTHTRYRPERKTPITNAVVLAKDPTKPLHVTNVILVTKAQSVIEFYKLHQRRPNRRKLYRDGKDDKGVPIAHRPTCNSGAYTKH